MSDSKQGKTAGSAKGPAGQGFFNRAGTLHGQVAFWLMVAFIALFLINAFVFMPSSSDAPWRQIFLPFYAVLMLACGLTSGIMGLLALIKDRERSWMAWFSLLPAAWVVFMLLGELLVPH